MNEDKYYFECDCSISIGSEIISLSEMSATIGLVPDESFEKGDMLVGKKTKTITYRTNHMWRVRSKGKSWDYLDVSHHIHVLEQKLSNHIESIRAYKNNPLCHIKFTIWVQTDYIAVTLVFSEKELSFINDISNSFEVLTLTTEEK